LALLPLCLTYGALPVDPTAGAGTAVTAGTGYAGPSLRESLPSGVHLPADVVVLGTPTTSEHGRDLHEWRVDVRLTGTTIHTALDSLSDELTTGGWQVRRSSTDVFAVRRSGDRWELFQARVDPGHSPSFHGAVLAIGIGSRPA
jgi:hypothetical protein